MPRYADGRPITSGRYDHLWTRIGRRLPWVRTQQISMHWIRHTTLTWVEGRGVASDATFGSLREDALPAAQRAAGDLGIGLLGKPDWSLLSVVLVLDWLSSLQILLLDLGFLLTLYTAWRIANRHRSREAGAFGLFAPWAALAILLYVVGIWIIFQPMQMRGLMVH